MTRVVSIIEIHQRHTKEFTEVIRTILYMVMESELVPEYVDFSYGMSSSVRLKIGPY